MKQLCSCCLQTYTDHEETERFAAGSDKNETKEKKQKKKPIKAEREKLKSGMVVGTNTHKYTVIDLLGSGGFGDVYRVQQQGGELYAMKTEMFGPNVNKRLLRLKMETTILTQCHAVSDPNQRKHFVAMADKGRTDQFKFLVMGLVGPSLDDIRKDIVQKNFSKSSAQQCAEQTLQSIWDLHEIGYLHRDIKPQNFAVGLGDKQSTVYMLDFGIARKFIDSNRVMKMPREKVKFIGTVRFASRNCHEQKEQGRMDDLEVWLYMVVDLFDFEGIPWRRMVDKAEVLKIKKDFFELKFNQVFKLVPIDYKVIIKYVNTLKYTDIPDYSYILTCLDKMYEPNKIEKGAKVDWAGKIKPKELKADQDEDSDMEKEGSEGSDSTSDSAKEPAKKVRSKDTKSSFKEKSNSTRTAGTNGKSPSCGKIPAGLKKKIRTQSTNPTAIKTKMSQMQ